MKLNCMYLLSNTRGSRNTVNNGGLTPVGNRVFLLKLTTCVKSEVVSCESKKYPTFALVLHLIHKHKSKFT